jgi:hypothetical protein
MLARRTALVLATALSSGGVLAGCNLVGSSGLQTDYSFDALSYASPEYGPSTGTVPEVPCTVGGTDVCTAAATTMFAGQNITMSCDPMLQRCVARAEVRVSQTVDISKQMNTFPAQAIQFGVEVVEVKRVTYWIDRNTLNVATPGIEIYVAPSAARDETDPKAALLATVAPLPATSNACGDAAYDKGDARANGAPVCSAPLPEPGKAALGEFVKAYETPFQVMAHAVIVAKPGDPIPSGGISFSARPTVGLKIID